MTDRIAETSVTLPLDAGGGWHLFTYDYMTQDGLFTGYLYALDMGHAEQLLSEMRATAVLSGQMIDSHDDALAAHRKEDDLDGA